MSRYQNKKKGGKRKTRKTKINKVIEKIPKEELKIGKKGVILVEKIPKEALKVGKKIIDVGGEILEKGFILAEKPLEKMKDVVEKVLPDMPTDKGPFKVNIKKRTKDAKNALKEMAEMGVKVPKFIVHSGEKVLKKVSHIPGLRKIKKVPGKILGLGKEVFTRVNKKTRKLLGKIPIKKAIKKVEKIPRAIVRVVTDPCKVIGEIDEKKPHIPKIPMPKICGVKPTTIVKDIGYSMINGVKSGAKSVTHLAKKVLPTFVWPVDGRCPISQKGGGYLYRRRRVKHKTRRRRRKTYRHKTRQRKKRYRRRYYKTRKKRKRRRKRRHTRRH